MRILLTGGAGFIGSALAEVLLEAGHDLAILDNLNDFYDPRIKEKNLADVALRGEYELWRIDLLDLPAVSSKFQGFQPEVVIHLAACAGVRPSLENPVLYNQVNVTGTMHMLELSRGIQLRQFIFGSSSSVYGINSKVPFGEEDPLDRPISPYAVTKRAGELLCHTYHHNYGLPVTCLRFFTVYGPRQRPDMAVHKFTRMILNEEPIPVFHQGKSQRDYTYVNDIVQGILATLGRPSPFEIFNLGNSVTVPLLDLIRLIERITGKAARLNLQEAQPGDVPITFADISKAERLLGYRPETPIEEGVANFVRWYMARDRR